jgi:predicted acetyltransferase
MDNGPEIRPFGPDDDIEAELDLRRRAFGPMASPDDWAVRMQAVIEAGQMLGVFDGTRPVASARYYAMRQWWHGRSMPMAGVAGVKVAPEERGRGLGRALMARLLAELAAAGYAVSTLYPSTLPLYRSLGWENAGGLYEAVMPARALTALTAADPQVPPAPGPASPASPGGVPAEPAGAGPARVRRANGADAAAVVAALGSAHQALRDNGPTTREPAELVRWLENPDQFAYLADDGFLSYRWANGHEEVEVDYLVAGSAATARAFWQILGSHATMASRVRACLAPHDPVGWLLTDPAVVTSRIEPWMLRIIDPAQAIAARGFPSAASLEVAVDVNDQDIPANSALWILQVSGGAGKLAPAGGESGRRALRLGARGLAALFAGVPLATLRRAGLVAGDTRADEALDCAFAGPAFMYDYF